VNKNQLLIKQKLYFKIDFSKKEVEQERRIIQLESELQRTLEKITSVKVKREELQKRTEEIKGNIELLNYKKQKHKQKLEHWNYKTESVYRTLNLPLIRGQEKMYKEFGEKFEKVRKSLKEEQSSFTLLKNALLIKVNKRQTQILKLVKQIKLTKQYQHLHMRQITH